MVNLSRLRGLKNRTKRAPTWLENRSTRTLLERPRRLLAGHKGPFCAHALRFTAAAKGVPAGETVLFALPQAANPVPMPDIHIMSDSGACVTTADARQRFG